MIIASLGGDRKERAWQRDRTKVRAALGDEDLAAHFTHVEFDAFAIH